MATETVAGKPGVSAMIRQSFTAMTPEERLRVIAMYGAILFLHLLAGATSFFRSLSRCRFLLRGSPAPVSSRNG